MRRRRAFAKNVDGILVAGDFPPTPNNGGVSVRVEVEDRFGEAFAKDVSGMMVILGGVSVWVKFVNWPRAAERYGSL